MIQRSRKSIPFLVLCVAVTASGMTKTENKQSAQATVFSKQKKGTLGGIRRNLDWAGPLCDQVTLVAGEGYYDAATKTGAWAERGKRVVGSKGHAKAGVTLFSLKGESKTWSAKSSSAKISWNADADLGLGVGYEVSAGQSGFTAKLEAGASARANVGNKVEVTTRIDGVEVKGTVGMGASAGWAASFEALVQADWDPTTDKKTRISLKYGAAHMLGFYTELELEVDTSSLVESILHGDGLRAWAEWLRERHLPEQAIRWMLSALKAMAKKAESELERREEAKQETMETQDPSQDTAKRRSQDADTVQTLSSSDRPKDASPVEDARPTRDADPASLPAAAE